MRYLIKQKSLKSGKLREPSAKDLILGFARNVRIN